MPLLVFRPKRGKFGNLSPEITSPLTLTAEAAAPLTLTAESATPLVLTPET